MKKIKVGILGATGVIGTTYQRLLREHPWFEIAFTAAQKSLSSLDEIETAQNRGVKLIFSALPDESAKLYDEEYGKKGMMVISHAPCHRLKEHVPLIVPEINGASLDNFTGKLIAKPNCTQLSYLIPLAPLHSAFRLKEIHVVTLQAISGAGNGLPAIAIQDNVIPYIAEEEEKLEREPLKILQAPLKISAHCMRVPILHGHTASVSASFHHKPSLNEVKKMWDEFPGLSLPSAPKKPIHFHEERERPQPRYDLEVERGMSVSVGGLREAPFFDLRFTGLSHNAVRGGAGGGLLIAELLFQKGLL